MVEISFLFLTNVFLSNPPPIFSIARKFPPLSHPTPNPTPVSIPPPTPTPYKQYTKDAEPRVVSGQGTPSDQRPAVRRFNLELRGH